jgi:integrase
MKITIYPKKPDKQNFVRLYLYVSVNGSPCWLPTKVKIVADNWDQGNQTITAKQFEYKKAITMLDKRKGQLAKVFQDLEYEGIQADSKIVLIRYNAALKHKTIKQGKVQIQLFEYIQQYVDDRKSIRSDKGYLRKFKTMSDHLKGFNSKLTFGDITQQFYNEFLEYLYGEECELENNTVSGYIKKLKSVMAAALMDQRTRFQDIPIDFKLFKDTYIKPKPIWLDWDTEVKKLEAYKPMPDHLIYKQEFLFRCYTGIRHSDVFSAKPENFIYRGESVYLDFMSIKTRTDQNLLLNPKAVQILKAWSGKPPKLYPSPCNEAMRSICEGAKINTMVEKVRFAGNQRKVSLLPKWDLVTTHVARRTFARHWMENGGTLSRLSIYLGHSTEKQTAEYVGWSTEEVNNEMARLFK